VEAIVSSQEYEDILVHLKVYSIMMRGDKMDKHGITYVLQACHFPLQPATILVTTLINSGDVMIRIHQH
jgi:hypothetical protein